MQQDRAEFQIEQRAFSFTTEEGQLTVRAGGQSLVRLNLLPAIQGESLSLGPWRQVNPTHVTSSVAGLGSVHVAMKHGYPAYWVETDRTQFDLITYFPASPFEGVSWQPFSNDEDDRPFDADLDAATVVSSNYTCFHPDQDHKDPWASTLQDGPADWTPGWVWNIPVRAMAMRGGSGWLGLAIPGPLPVGFTRFQMEQRRFSMPFEILRPGCEDGQMPVVYLAPGLVNAEDVMDVQHELTGKMNLLRPRSPDHPSWWAAPCYKPGFELLRLHDWRILLVDDKGEVHTHLTTENVLDWVHKVKKSVAIGQMNVEFDQIYHPCYGDYTPLGELGGTEGMRRLIDDLREEDIRVGLYIHLYLVSSLSSLYRRRPEVVCKKRDPDFEEVHGVQIAANETLHMLDWTLPAAREEMLEIVRFMISDEPGCLNADWLAINSNMGIDLREYKLYDPDWGIGDLMTMKVNKMIYEHVKGIKPHALVKRHSPADSYMQPYCDRALSSEQWLPRTDYWYKRARIITRTHPTDVLHSTDAFFVTRYKANEFFMALMVWNVPEIDAVEHAIHTRMTFEKLKEKEYRRRRAGIQCYLNAPANITDQVHVDWHDQHHITAWRKRTHGPLAGFYAALALSPRCFVTYNATQALVAASENRTVAIPLPQGTEVKTVEAVPHEGPARPHAYDLMGDRRLKTHIADAAGDIMLYRIVYERVLV